MTNERVEKKISSDQNEDAVKPELEALHTTDPQEIWKGQYLLL